MGKVSYTAHISNKKSGITSKSKLQGVAKHNLRKYKSEEYSKDNIEIIFGTDDLYKDVRNVYHQEFDEAVKEYNAKQKRADRKIDDYFEHVAGLSQDIAVEIIFQCGNKEFWDEHEDSKWRMHYVYNYLLCKLEEFMPNFKIASAVIHFDEASPHMHLVGVPVWGGAKKGLRKKVSKRNVFTPQTLSDILQGKLREEVGNCFEFNIREELAEKGKGRNYDLSVVEYKVMKEKQNLKHVTNEIGVESEALVTVRQAVTAERNELERIRADTNVEIENGEAEVKKLQNRKKLLDEEVSKKEIMLDIADMELSQKEKELKLATEKMQRNLEEAEALYKKYASLPLSERHYRSMEDMIALTQRVSELEEENRKLHGLLQKAYDFMKNFVIDGMTLLDKFLETIGNKVQQIFIDKKR